MQQVAHQEH